MSSSRLTTILFCSLLAACGGGGGGGAGQPASAATQEQASITSSGGGSTAQPASADATQARFNRPLGIAVDGTGNLYVADSYNFTIRKITRAGAVTTLAGSPGASGSADGTGASARFSFPQGVAVDAAGNVYVVDSNAIRKITPTGAVTTLAGVADEKGSADGSGANARFNQPWGIAVDAAGNLYVADTYNYVVRKITPAGVVSTLAGTSGMRGNANGSAAAATFLGPRGVAVDGAGNLYVADWYGPPAPIIPQGSTFVRKIAANGEVSTLAGSYASSEGPAQFRDVIAIAADASGNAYVADHQSIRKIGASGEVTPVVNSSAQFDSLQGIALEGDGTMYVTDTYTVDKVAKDGTIAVIAGKFGEMGSADAP